MTFTFDEKNLDKRYAGVTFDAAWCRLEWNPEDACYEYMPAKSAQNTVLCCRGLPHLPGWSPVFNHQDFGTIE